ncbi:MAG: protoheme IX farnesyltransferase [Nitrospirae bacterium]|nr:protoheme IX farnesyltransferase [Nitrospirota bacterium]
MINPQSYLTLCKIRISLLSSFSAAVGFMLSTSRVTPLLIPLITGVFFLACGACALNQYQERDLDALMPRTRTRPIPSGKIKPLNSLLFSAILMTSGFIILLSNSGFTASVTGLFAVAWYNGVYTYLKKKTAFAVIPGALTGAVPPAIGWIAGGGAVSDPDLLIVCFFFFMWQVPHFWLFIVNYGAEYEKAGIPSLTAIFTRTQLKRIIFIWIISASVSCLLLSLRDAAQIPVITFSLFAVSLWIVWCGSRLLKEKDVSYSLIFNKINIYMFCVLILLSVNNLLI